MPGAPLLSIVVPVYNEERTLATLMKSVMDACGDFSQIIYVDDGSKDGSAAILKQHARAQDVVLQKENGGKGSAVRMGYERAEGLYTIVQDADLEYDPRDIPKLLKSAQEKNSQALFGSRRLKHQKQFHHLTFFIGGSLLTQVCNLLYGTGLTDQPTCYKMVRTDIIKQITLKENDFRFDPELTVRLALAGVKIDEYPVSYHPRSIAEGKKINWKDFFRWLWVFFTLRFSARQTLHTQSSAQ